jgi:signal transduction histidine kinase
MTNHIFVSSTMSQEKYSRAMQHLVAAVQQLSLARDMDTIAMIVRDAARELTGADGATFVLRDGDLCYYVDENAIEPLWKGKRFPMSVCISGWAMLNKQSVVIKDIYQDSRIPIDAYRPTFVKSLAMVPIRTSSPIGAIGNYWAKYYVPSKEEVGLLQALADSTSIAVENVQLYLELEQRVKDRTAELEMANKELEAFSYSVSHDLRSPLNIINGYTSLLSRNYDKVLDHPGREYLDNITLAINQMTTLIEDLLSLSRVSLADIKPQKMNVSDLVRDIYSELVKGKEENKIQINIEENIFVCGDHGLLRIVLQNLLQNAIKYSSKNQHPAIYFGASSSDKNHTIFYVRDNGIGFSMDEAKNLFLPFHRLSNAQSFTGTGIGLATTARAIQRQGGKIWAESEVGKGATFFAKLPA